MAIPEGQLETWANQGATDGAKKSHEYVRSALAANVSLQQRSYEVFLQGSYRNDTNIWRDSDVDVVAQLNNTWRADTSLLAPADRQNYEGWSTNATYEWSDFRSDVIAALTSRFGAQAVSLEPKCITVKTGVGQMTADVLVAIEYRTYLSFADSFSQQFIPGVLFFTAGGQAIINYPKHHYNNGVQKNSQYATNGWYKHAIRIFKNARNQLIETYGFPNDHAPSYFVECLLYNVPNQRFGGTYAGTFAGVTSWLNATNPAGFACQNGLIPLFGSDGTQWRLDHAVEFIQALSALWQNW